MTVFPKGKHDDQVDSTAQFLDWYKKPFPSQGHYEYMRQRAQELQQRDKPQPTKTVWAIGSMGMARRAKGSGLNRGVRCGAPIPRSQPCDKGDNGAHRGRGTEGSNPSPSSGESGANSLNHGRRRPFVCHDMAFGIWVGLSPKETRSRGWD